MKKLKDIRHNLPEDVDIQSQYTLNEIDVHEGLEEKNTQDILPNLPDIDL